MSPIDITLKAWNLRERQVLKIKEIEVSIHNIARWLHFFLLTKRLVRENEDFIGVVI